MCVCHCRFSCFPFLSIFAPFVCHLDLSFFVVVAFCSAPFAVVAFSTFFCFISSSRCSRLLWFIVYIFRPVHTDIRVQWSFWAFLCACVYIRIAYNVQFLYDICTVQCERRSTGIHCMCILKRKKERKKTNTTHIVYLKPKEQFSKRHTTNQHE